MTAPLVLTEVEKEDLLDHISAGGGLYIWARNNGHRYSSVNRAIESDPEYCKRYARAREDQADYLADEIKAISDDGSNDTYIDENGNRKTDHDVIARSKLRVDSRKWVAAKLRPAKYGDKLGLGGAEGLPPVATTSTFVINGVKPNSTG